MLYNYHLQLASKLEALREEYMRFAVEKCSSALREHRPAVEKITGQLFLHFLLSSLFYFTCFWNNFMLELC